MFEKLKSHIDTFSKISDEDWQLLLPQLKIRYFNKNQFYLREGDVEQQIGFLNSGLFRWYYINKDGDESNYHFFFDENFVVDYHSFVTQQPSRMFIQALEPAEVVLLPKRDLILSIYKKSHAWESFGRLIAEASYIETAKRAHDFLFLSPEERYLELIKMRPDIINRVSLTNISSYLGVKPQSLSRIRKRLMK